MTDELKPCPFCGGKAEHYKPHPDHPIYHIACSNEECCLAGFSIVSAIPGSAERQWNTRAPDTTRTDRLVEALRQARDVIQEDRDDLFASMTVGGDAATLDADDRPFVERLDTVLATIAAVLSNGEADAPPTDDEKRAQAARCSCNGTDDYCPCQNAPDAATRRLRAEAAKHG